MNQVKAPNVWALGFNGTGIVVAVQDTGDRWTHNALKPKYRGWNGSAADHNYNWWDAIHSGGGICTPNHQEPCDDFFHGTHVTEPPSVTTAIPAGTRSASLPAPSGSAAGTWIRERNAGDLHRVLPVLHGADESPGAEPGSDAAAPRDEQQLGLPGERGLRGDTLQQVVENTQAAGIFVEVSAGNAGPSCSSVNDPPAIYAASYRPAP